MYNLAKEEILKEEVYAENNEFLDFERSNTLEEIYSQIITSLKRNKLNTVLEYFEIFPSPNPKQTLPINSFLSIYTTKPLDGGHIVCCDLVREDDSRSLIFKGKTVLGLSKALEISNVLTQLFYS